MQNLFGSNLSALRKKAGVSQETLADQLGVSRQAVSNWERNLSEPDIGTINQISELLHVPVSDLMGSPSGGGTQETAVKIRPALTIISMALATVHFALGIRGYVNIAAAIFLPVTCAFIQSIIYIAFTTMIKSDYYDMLAGFDPKKDSVPKTRLQMQWIVLLSGLTSILFELIFVPIYFVPVEQQMDITTVLIFSYFAAVMICVITVNVKIKSRA